MPRIRDPEGVQYLAFEGGGGKGVTYVGAVRALEKLSVLPVKYERTAVTSIINGAQVTREVMAVDQGRLVQHGQRLQGLSGSSAGALTAFLLALGHTATSLLQLGSDRTALNKLYDKPQPARLRGVRGNKPDIIENPNLNGRSREEVVYERILNSPILAKEVVDLLVRDASNKNEMIRAISDGRGMHSHYWYNILFDRGLFPGFALRNYLALRLQLFLQGLPDGIAPADPSAAAQTFNFRQFSHLTGVNLVVTGTNVSTRRPAYFSAAATPEFPVIEAVGISMSFPLLFKPVIVVSDDESVGTGFWVDGGMLNNLPIHAFDGGPYNSVPVGMLAVRLTEGVPGQNPPGRPFIPARGWGMFNEMKAHLGDLAQTLMYPMEEGQLHSPDEALQTVDLYTYSLATTEFSPDADSAKQAIDGAGDAIFDYFRVPASQRPRL